ncbi:AT-hook motif nuclear-localized protein 9-like [Salvia miltiorrhiza]|uniref:AT-hook motif nuclear-localized protein 9-like n=1 Tax=Salvia miltiorrhiza TaxID=226208 RepID=UPI0025AC6649|nr:AT-hook motif nuclear-localized protein 9-like [Salvia miltiorrhiza]XP_057805459.1 AT-hook motif nuclear-localized protein 9-like [Salvia miltiorrhiza]
MDDSDVGNAVNPTAAEHDGLQVAAAAPVEGEGENRLESSGGGDGGGHEGAMVAVANGGGDGGFREKRKRGRPRKQLGEIQPEFRVVAEDPGGPQKRGRGRPKGSGKWQTLAASFGLNGGEAGGSNFTPYIIDVEAGENIVERIWSFSKMTCDSICILSASGSISTAQIFLPASRDRILKWEGHFTIVCLNGSHTYDDKGAKTGLLTVQLANSDGRFYGGAVAGSLIAAGPTQIIVSTFRQKRQQASLRPPNMITAPKLSDNGTVENGESEQVRDEGATFNVGHPSSAPPPPPPPPPQWKSLQPPSNV